MFKQSGKKLVRMNTQYPINVGPGCLQGEAEQANEDYANAIYNGHFEEALELVYQCVNVFQVFN